MNSQKPVGGASSYLPKSLSSGPKYGKYPINHHKHVEPFLYQHNPQSLKNPPAMEKQQKERWVMDENPRNIVSGSAATRRRRFKMAQKMTGSFERKNQHPRAEFGNSPMFREVNRRTKNEINNTVQEPKVNLGKITNPGGEKRLEQGSFN